MATHEAAATTEAVDDERALVAGLRRSEAAAFDRVYARYRPRLFSFLYRLAGRRDVAEDLFQETWLRLATHAPRLAEDTRLAPWLFTVARNRFVSHRRFLLFDAERLRRFGFGDTAASETPFDALSHHQTGRRLERALRSLSAADREVVLLVAAGLSTDEAATVLGVRDDALRQRLSRARARLAEKLDTITDRDAALPRAADVDEEAR